MVKISKFWDQPLVYVFLALFSIFILLLYDRLAGQVLLGLSLTAGLLYGFVKPRIRINSVKGNTLKSAVIAVIALAITIALSIATGVFIFGASIDGGLSGYLAENKAAVLGSETLPFAGNPILTFLVFVIAFPITETVIVLQMLDLVLKKYNVRLDLKDYRVWLISALISIGMILYHIYAKATVTGEPNPAVLMVIFNIFFVECLLAVYMKEKESSIYHHMLNNLLALL